MTPTRQVGTEKISVRVFESRDPTYQEPLQEVLNEIASTPGNRIISISPGTPDKLGYRTVLIWYASPADTSTDPTPPPPAAAARCVRRGLPVAPGDYLAEYMEELNTDRQGLASILEWSEPELDAVLKGRTAITPGMATRLEQVVGMPAASWLRYEAVYRADLAAAESDGHVVALPASEEDIHAAAKAISPNPKHWKEFVPTVRRVLAAIEKSQKA